MLFSSTIYLFTCADELFYTISKPRALPWAIIPIAIGITPLGFYISRNSKIIDIIDKHSL